MSAYAGYVVLGSSPTSPPVLERIGADTATSTGTTVTAGASNTKGSWIELAAATTVDADGFFLVVNRGNNTISAFLLDIGIGGAGSEVALLENVSLQGYANIHTFVPLPIPAGTRIAARCQSETNSATILVTLNLCAGGVAEAASVAQAETLGANTVDSGGVEVDASGSANTKGTWTEIAAATSFAYSQLTACVTRQSAFASSQNGMFDIGIGVAASEVVIVENMTWFGDATPDVAFPSIFGPYPVDVPVGSRVAIRQQNSAASANTWDYVVIGYGGAV